MPSLSGVVGHKARYVNVGEVEQRPEPVDLGRTQAGRGRLYDPAVVAAHLRGEKGEQEMATVAQMDQYEANVQRAAQIIARADRPVTRPEVQAQLGVTQPTASRYLATLVERGQVDRIGDGNRQRYVLTTHPDTALQNGAEKGEGIKAGVAAVVAETPGMSTEELARALGRRDSRWATMGVHSILHVLFQMRKQGTIEFSLSRTGGGQQRATGIRLARQRVVTEVAPIEREHIPQPEAATPPPEEASVERESRWPILDALRAREVERAQAEPRATAWMEAAALLEETDPEMAEVLQAKAAALASDNQLSRVEAEYLAFAAAVLVIEQ